jgi:hypothetical protein
MNATQLLNEILAMLYQVKESKEGLEKIHTFIFDNFYVEEDSDLIIPEQYKKLVAEIAEEIDCRFTCQVNKKTATIISTKRENSFEETYYSEEEDEEEDEAESTENWEDIITICPLESHESFEIMENFTNTLSNIPLKKKLSNALQYKRPFANFNAIIHNSIEREEWFNFKKNALEQHVASLLMAVSMWE